LKQLEVKSGYTLGYFCLGEVYAGAGQKEKALEYLKKVSDYRDRVNLKKHEDMPGQLEGKEDAMAFYGVILPILQESKPSNGKTETIAAETALALVGIFKRNQKVQFWGDLDAQNKVKNEIDDHLYDEVMPKVKITEEQMNGIIDKVMRVAQSRSAQ